MSQDIGLYGLLAAVVAAISTSIVAIVKLFKTKQNGNSKVRDPVPTATQIVAQIDPRDSDAAKIAKLEGQLLLIREDEALKFKEKVEGLAKTVVTIQSLTDDIMKELSEVILLAGQDRSKFIELDKRVDIIKALQEYDRRRKNPKNGEGSPM